MSWSERVWYKGGGGRRVRVNNGLKLLLIAANKMLRTRRFGGEREGMNAYQGSFSAGSQSAGTHTGSGAIDLTSFNQKNRVFVLRLLGMAAWYRYRTSYWVAHIHAILVGDGGVSRSAKNQVAAYQRRPRRNGLAGNGLDNGPKMLVDPLFVSPEKETGQYGKRWVAVNCHAYTQQTTRAAQYGAFTKGDQVETIAVTAIINNGEKEYWHITAEGRCFYGPNLSREPVAA